jgi:hypothetical protein
VLHLAAAAAAATQVAHPEKQYRMVVSMSLGAPGPLTIERMYFRWDWPAAATAAAAAAAVQQATVLCDEVAILCSLAIKLQQTPLAAQAAAA